MFRGKAELDWLRENGINEVELKERLSLKTSIDMFIGLDLVGLVVDL